MSGGAVGKDLLKEDQILEISAGTGKKAGDAKMAPTVSSCTTCALSRKISAGTGKKARDVKMAPTVSSCMTCALSRGYITDSGFEAMKRSKT